MGDTVSKFFLDNSYLEVLKEEESLNEDVNTIIQLFRILSVAEKVKVKELIRNESIF